MIYCFHPSDLDSERYSKGLINHQFKVLSYDKLTLFKAAFVLSKNDSIIFNGARWSDRKIAKYLVQNTNLKIIIYQHNKVIPKYSLDEKIKKIWKLKHVYIRWVIYTYFYIFCMHLFGIRHDRKQKNIKICYLSEEYKELWIRELSSHIEYCSYSEYSEPNPLIFGTNKPTIEYKVTDACFVLVDEPFEETIQVSSEVVLQHALKISNGKKILIKIHPRSQPDKYEHYLSHNIEILHNKFPSGEITVLGYDSNLFHWCSNNYRSYKFNRKSLIFNEHFVQKQMNSDVEKVNLSSLITGFLESVSEEC